MEVTKALATLQPLYGKDNVEIETVDGQRVRGIAQHEDHAGVDDTQRQDGMR